MPMPCYISFEGVIQGPITAGASTVDSIGELGREGHEDEMMIQEFKHRVAIPTNPQSGNPTGNPVHEALEFRVTLNKAVPLMYNALTTSEKLTNVQIKWYRFKDGKTEHFFTTALDGAQIVDIRCEMPNVTDPANEDVTQNVTVAMSYRNITWDHVVAGTSGSFDWKRSNEA